MVLFPVVAYTRGSITRWSRPAGVCALVALLVPDGALRWTFLSLAGVFLVIALTRVPREAWAAHRVLVATLGSAVAAICAVELLPLSPAITTWTVGVTGLIFVAVVVVSTVRLIRRRRDGSQGI
jgi:hypothetical protein